MHALKESGGPDKGLAFCLQQNPPFSGMTVLGYDARMLHDIALVHKDKSSAFGVQFPDVPGCFSAADEMDDLVANAMEALSLWAEDEALPEARSIDRLKKDKSIAREWAEGARRELER